MKRGILQLNEQEINLLHHLLLDSERNISPLLLSKLTVNSSQEFSESAGNEATDEKILPKDFTIELSEDDAEIILDSMSSPLQTDSLVLVSARSKIQQFLSKMRF